MQVVKAGRIFLQISRQRWQWVTRSRSLMQERSIFTVQPIKSCFIGTHGSQTRLLSGILRLGHGAMRRGAADGHSHSLQTQFWYGQQQDGRSRLEVCTSQHLTSNSETIRLLQGLQERHSSKLQIVRRPRHVNPCLCACACACACACVCHSVCARVRAHVRACV